MSRLMVSDFTPNSVASDAEVTVSASAMRARMPWIRSIGRRSTRSDTLGGLATAGFRAARGAVLAMAVMVGR
jgi:hypothetical protein